MKATGKTFAALLALATSLPAIAQQDNADANAAGTKKPSAKQGISILELDDNSVSPIASPKASPTPATTQKSGARNAIPANTVPAKLTNFATTEEQDSNEAELVRQRFANGALQVERWVKEDADGNIVNHGTYTEYNAKQEIIASGTYELGKRQGTWTKQMSLDEAKKLSSNLDSAFTPPFTSQADYRQGKLQGEWIVTDSKGNIVFTWSMENGERHGASVFFSPKGDVIQSITYDHNIAHGPAKIVQTKGKNPESLELIHGMVARRVEKFYPAKNGNKGTQTLQSQEWQLAPTDFNIASHDWDQNRVETKPLTASSAIRHGMAVTFYSNGQRESEGNYENGKKNGTFVWWYPNGQQKTVGEYRDDVEHADWQWWHENGMKQATGKYADGKKVNEWSVWNTDGALVKRQSAEQTQVAELPTGGADNKLKR